MNWNNSNYSSGVPFPRSVVVLLDARQGCWRLLKASTEQVHLTLTSHLVAVWALKPEPFWEKQHVDCVKGRQDCKVITQFKEYPRWIFQEGSGHWVWFIARFLRESQGILQLPVIIVLDLVRTPENFKQFLIVFQKSRWTWTKLGNNILKMSNLIKWNVHFELRPSWTCVPCACHLTINWWISCRYIMYRWPNCTNWSNRTNCPKNSEANYHTSTNNGSRTDWY